MQSAEFSFGRKKSFREIIYCLFLLFASKTMNGFWKLYIPQIDILKDMNKNYLKSAFSD